MHLKIISEDDTLLVVDKPAGLTVEQIEKELARSGVERRGGGGVAHRLDKDTSGILLVAKTPENLEQLRRQFAQRQVEKRYLCLVEGTIKQKKGVIHTLLARSPADRRKQKTFPLSQRKAGRREAITEWRVLRYFRGYTLLGVIPKTGRKHQIRAHMASIGHPVAGDKLYAFKNQCTPEGLTRHFLHASYLKIEDKEFHSELPKELQAVLENLSQKSNLPKKNSANSHGADKMQNDNPK